MYRRRVLIIGNSNYEHEKLNNCVNDATDFHGALKQKYSGEVDLQLNLKSEEMHTSINKFIRLTESMDFIVFYFLGHAIQWRDQNFLLPCDNSEIRNANSVHRYAINAQSIIDDMATRNPRVAIFLFDCCRNYSLPATATNKLSIGKQSLGLHEMKAPENTIIAFPCIVGGAVSSEIKLKNDGLFTKYLLKHITTPNVHIETILHRVTTDIVKETDNVQRLHRVGYLNFDAFLIECGRYFTFVQRFFFVTFLRI